LSQKVATVLSNATVHTKFYQIETLTSVGKRQKLAVGSSSVSKRR
jgi:hypothetical protein